MGEKISISPQKIKQAILESAKAIGRKKELYNQVVEIEKELGSINEMITGGFGFVGDSSSENKTGFVDSNSQSISNIARLEREFAEADRIKEGSVNENEKLKDKIQELEDKLAESEKLKTRKAEKIKEKNKK